MGRAPYVDGFFHILLKMMMIRIIYNFFKLLSSLSSIKTHHQASDHNCDLVHSIVYVGVTITGVWNGWYVWRRLFLSSKNKKKKSLMNPWLFHTSGRLSLPQSRFGAWWTEPRMQMASFTSLKPLFVWTVNTFGIFPRVELFNNFARKNRNTEWMNLHTLSFIINVSVEGGGVKLNGGPQGFWKNIKRGVKINGEWERNRKEKRRN